uniref:Uncharacterized protein n=1 Tax=Oryza brachyantha TaxID=4533 RepID=J3NE33_ORYBR
MLPSSDGKSSRSHQLPLGIILFGGSDGCLQSIFRMETLHKMSSNIRDNTSPCTNWLLRVFSSLTSGSKGSSSALAKNCSKETLFSSISSENSCCTSFGKSMSVKLLTKEDSRGSASVFCEAERVDPP